MPLPVWSQALQTHLAKPLTNPFDAIEAIIDSRRNPKGGPQTPGQSDPETPKSKERPWRRLWR